MRRKTQPPYRLSERVHLRAGDLLRVSGGPVYCDGETVHRFGYRGIVRFDRAFELHGRPYLAVRTLECVDRKKGTVLMGQFLTLYVGDKPFRSPLFPKMINRPYRVRRVRRKAKA